MSLIAAVQTLTPGSLVHMYEIEKADGSYVRFSMINHANNSPIQMYDYTDNSQLNTYYTIPISADGFEKNQSGAMARPRVRVSSATNSTDVEKSFKEAIGGDYNSLLGKKFIRRTTMEKYLKDGTADTGAGNTPIEFNREVWIIDKISSEDSISSNDSDMETIEDDEVIIVYDDDITNLISQIESNIKNGININNIFVFIHKDNEDQEDIFNLIVNIYEHINFILDDDIY